MSETTDTNTAAAEEAAQTTTKSAPAEDTTDWKAEARKWEARAKENAPAAKRLAEIEEANKTEAERVAERIAAAEARAAELEVKALRAEVANAKGVPAHLLAGSTQEELEAAADALIAFRGEQKQTPSSTAIGRANGASVAATPADAFAEHLQAQLNR